MQKCDNESVKQIYAHYIGLGLRLGYSTVLLNIFVFIYIYQFIHLSV